MAVRDGMTAGRVAPAPTVRTVAVFVDQAAETSFDVPEPALETTGESVMVIEIKDAHRPATVEDGPTASIPDGGNNDDEDLPARDATETDLVVVEDRSYAAPNETLKKFDRLIHS